MKRVAFFVCVFFTFLDAESVYGQSINLLRLSELEDRLKGRDSQVYVVNFWATWCAPCVKELPNFQEIHEKYEDARVKVLLVSLDAKASMESKVRPFVNRTGMTTDFFLLDETNQQEYIDRIDSSWSGALPATLIINPGKGKKVFIEGELTLGRLEEMLEEVME